MADKDKRVKPGEGFRMREGFKMRASDEDDTEGHGRHYPRASGDEDIVLRHKARDGEESHRSRADGDDKDTEGHGRHYPRATGDDKDTEGHGRHYPRATGDDDVALRHKARDGEEGHRSRADGDDKDTEGHAFRRRSPSSQGE